MSGEDIYSLLNAIRALPAREREIYCERYGLYDGETKTLDALGKRFNLSRERIRQIERQITIRLSTI